LRKRLNARVGVVDLAHDVGEERDLSAQEPQKTAELAALWEAWAAKVGVRK